MQKIVINRCYGGFSLSALGVKAYYAKKGVEATIYKWEHLHTLKRIEAEDAGAHIFMAFSRDLGEKPACVDKYYLTDRDMPRDDPDLIATVEELGAKASGECAQLVIVEIPDDVNWTISDYDGRESVEEAHRAWRA